jgi:tetratricopeptide (TPR) repeat protein
VRAALLGAVALVLAAGSAAAQGADEAEGRRRWKHGQELYDEGRYLDAAHEFEAGYAIAPRPLFFLSIGHAYRKAHDYPKAKAAYEKLLSLQPDFAGRAEVEGYIRQMNEAPSPEGNPPPSRPPPPTPSVAPAPLPAAPPPPAPEPAPEGTAQTSSNGPPVTLLPAPTAPPLLQATAAESPPESRSDSVLHKPWFWVLAGAVLAGGVAAVIIAAHPNTSCPATACFRETR